MATKIFVYWPDRLGGGGHLTIIVGTGDEVFTNKNCQLGRPFDQIFKIPGVCPGICSGGCSCIELNRT